MAPEGATSDVEEAADGLGQPARSAEAVLDQRLKRLMLLRLVMVTTLLLVAAYVESVSESLLTVNPLYFLIGATYAFTLLHALALRFIPQRTSLAYAQVLGDFLVITGLVWLAGLSRAGFILLYPISVLSGSVLLTRGGALTMAGVATSLYAVLLAAVWFRWVPVPILSDIPYQQPRTLLYSVFVTGVVCFTVALVGSYLESSRRSVGEQLEEAEEQVADLQELNELIVSSIHSGLVTTDVQGRIQTINSFGELMLGAPAASLRGRPIDEVFGSRTLSPEVLRVRGGDSSLARIELGFERPDGDVSQFGVSVWPLARPGGDVQEGHLLVFQDLTNIKGLEAEVRMREKLSAVGEMAAQLAHEIRNPLGAISGSAQMLAGGSNMTSDQARLLEIITRESRRLSETLNRFLFQASESSQRAEPVDLRPVIEEAVTLLRNSPEVGPGREVRFEAEPGPFVCRADADQIAQVFWNLARNGLEAMIDGGLLTVRLGASGGEVVLSVHDQGSGIPGGEQSRIFEPFYTGRSMGTGLGLAIVYRIVRQHDGDISVRSTRGQGTEVQVRLPLLKQPVTA